MNAKTIKLLKKVKLGMSKKQLKDWWNSKTSIEKGKLRIALLEKLNNVHMVKR